MPFGRSLSNIPPSIFIDENNFKRAWAKLVMKIMQSGAELLTEYNNMSMDVQGTIVMYGDAIRQIENSEVHPKEPFGKLRIQEYKKQYNREYDWQVQGFEYTYIDRLVKPVDQLGVIKEQLQNNINSRRIQAITWQPEVDPKTEHPPCLQRIWIRSFANSTCEVHLSWRSRDAYGAWCSNVCAVTDMLHREVLDPNNLKLVKLVDSSNSLHVYDYDWGDAKKVTLDLEK